MSGIEQSNTVHIFGPRKQTRLELMGIRFANENENGENNNGGGGSDFNGPKSQEELDRIITDRLNREREKFKDFDAFKDKAGKWDALQSQPGGKDGDNDAVAQRLADFETRVQAAETKASDTETKLAASDLKALRSEIALDKGVKKEDLVLLTETTREGLEAQATRLATLYGGSGRVPGQGESTNGGGSSVSTGRDLFNTRHGKKTTTT